MPQKVTYPRFLNDGDGRLYFVYRSGGSGNGRTVISRYDAAKEKWHVKAKPLFSSKGTYEPWNYSTSRNAYLHDLLFDRDNRLHVTWVYREKGRSWASNHDLHYAYSDDLGITWMNNDGEKIADLSQQDAIQIDDPGIVVREIPVYSWLMNQCGMVLDSKNQPHVALYKLTDTFKPEKLEHDPPDDVKARLKFFHYWRDTNGQWHSSGPLERPEGVTIRRPVIATTPNDTVIIYWSSNQGFYGYIASADDNWQKWQLLKMTGPKFISNDASKYDRRILMEEGILSFTANPKGEENGKGYAIVDFDLRGL